MTKEELSRVMELRKIGLSYKDISVQTNIPVGTLKSTFSRIEEKCTETNNCKFCKKTLINTTGKKEKKYCSDKCRMSWWNSNREEGPKVEFLKVCANCQFKFPTRNKNQKYCSHRCYIIFRYKAYE